MTIDHREWLYMDVGWELMDLRQDIDFYDEFMAEAYPSESIKSRLMSLQQRVAEYADAHFPVVDHDEPF